MISELQEFMLSQATPVPMVVFVANFILSGVFNVILGIVYVHYGQAISNRKRFAGNFVVLGMTTMLIITIVKSSLALSLGLVGALSIVRFRAAIKEPEELTYLFLAIAIGLGLGANQAQITLIAFVIIVGVICARHFKKSTKSAENLVLNISSSKSDDINIKHVVDILKSHCLRINLRRFDESGSVVEASFIIETKDFDTLMKVKNELKSYYKNICISFLDNRGLV